MKVFIEIDEKDLAKVKAALEQEAAEEKPGKNKKASDVEKVTGTVEPAMEEGAADDYENMKAADLYKLCCERGISSQCKKRDKANLISVLRANEEKAAAEDDDWAEEGEEAADPYEGKTAMELYKMCVERGLKAQKKQKPEVYVKILKAADKAAETEEEDDEWEID